MAGAIKDLDLEHLWVLYPGDRTYALAPGVSALPLEAVGELWQYE